jgi:folate-binding protein YgfZ
MFSTEGYDALRQGCGVVQRGDRGLLRVSGPDRATWLQGLLTNDVVNLPPGGVCEAAYLTPQGRMISDVRVFSLDTRMMLDVPAPLAAALRTKLDSLLFSEDARVEDVSNDWRLIELLGPSAPSVADGLDAAAAGLDVVLIRHDAFDLPGFAALVPAAATAAFLDAVTARGAAPTTLETLDVIRVEAGRPAFLLDMDEHTIPLEAGIEDRTISFTKGCYVGQEVIVRVLHRGHGRVAKKLVGLALETGEVPPAGSAILAGEREIGRVTSAVWSPALAQAIALGYVHRDFTEPATRVSVAGPGGSVTAVIARLPFIGQSARNPPARA